jgi:hypothetical protein
MKFREHRGGLDASMATVVEFQNRAELLEHCQVLLGPYKFLFSDPHLQIFPYVHDNRIGWDTHIVIIQGYGPIGFTDGPVPGTGEQQMEESYPYHSFTPKPDITAWELAQIMKAMQMKMTANLVTGEIARHFTADTGN